MTKPTIVLESVFCFSDSINLKLRNIDSNSSKNQTETLRFLCLGVFSVHGENALITEL